MTLAKHPTATAMSIEKHLDAAFEATGLLVQALKLEWQNEQKDLASWQQAEGAYELLAGIRRRRGIK